MENLFYEKPKPENRYDLFKDDIPYQKKKLRRSTNDKIFFGVCGGIAERIGIASVLVRLVFTAGILLGGFGVILYACLTLVIPKNKHEVELENKNLVSVKNKKSLFGIILLFIGTYYSIMPTNYFPFLLFIEIPTQPILALLFLGFGFWAYKNNKNTSGEQIEVKYVRPRRGRLFLGVCIGISEYLGTYSILIRLVLIVFSFMTLGLGIVLYLLIAMLSETELGGEVEK